MRVQKSLKNIKYNLIFYILNTFLVFFSRKLFINTLGVDITGLNGLFQNIIGLLNIAELGICEAVTFSLYKPLKDQDYNKIDNIMQLYRKLYKIIALMIFLFSLVFNIFIYSFIKDTTLNINLVRIYFFLYTLLPISSYLLSYLQIIIIADQKKYIISKIMSITVIFKTIMQICMLLVWHSYAVWIIIDFVFNLCAYYFINREIKKGYFFLNKSIKLKLIELLKSNMTALKNIKDLIFHKIGSIVIWQTDNIVIAIFLSLKNVAVYTNYLMIIGLINGLVNQFYGGIRASIGNLIFDEDNNKSYLIWKKLYTLTTLIAFVICFCCYKLLNNFVVLWIGKELLVNNLTLICIIINLYFSITRQITDCFKDGYGIFWDTWVPLLEACVNLIVSIYLVNRIGLIGVVIGTNISNCITIMICKPIILFIYGFKKNIIYYFSLTIKLLIIGIISLFVADYLINFIILNLYIVSWIDLITKSVLVFINSILITFLFSLSIYEVRIETKIYFLRFARKYFIKASD